MNFDPKIYKQMLSDFSNINVLVLGDLMLDKYIQGSVSRISPEAPVPVVKVENTDYRIGGAGNVAANLASLNCNVTVGGICGDDTYGNVIFDRLSQQSINPLIIKDKNRPTTVKTRIIAQHQQIVRIDEEETSDIDIAVQNQLLDLITSNNHKFDGIILSDYSKGLLTENFIKKIESSFSNIPIIIDPKGHDYNKYKAATVIKPNWHEFKLAVNIPDLKIENIEQPAKAMVKKLELDGIIITLGENGVFVLDNFGKCQILPTVARDVFDVSGAGDTFIATFSAALLSSQNWLIASSLANIASGIVVGKLGTAVVHNKEIMDKILF